jgi:hypothetical protein
LVTILGKGAKISRFKNIFELPDIPSLSAPLKRASNAVVKHCFEAFFVE